MIVRAVAMPGTPLLVPGVAGRAEVLAGTRAQVLDALGELSRDARRVVVLDCGARRAGERRGAMRPALEAAGVDRRWWGWAPRASADGLPAAGVAASVALLALDAAGWQGPVEVVELGSATVPAAAVGLVREVLAEPGTGLVVVTGARPPLPDGAAHPASAGAAGGTAVSPEVGRSPAEDTVLRALGEAWDSAALHATGEYEERLYEVVRYGVPADERAATVPR
ncbi:hypothetical protein EQW78_05255 [Oerskovia turbata]|uniref:Uncharacterized protein n=1 Tax=Oerskovia turbata TaxID=1713 RepID=A0A4Q1L1E2_9CELL|nr:hypothetical protein [Oerskovia turbata]RXR27833.1 hypothetical protein EQW73_00495 [Oerskovia turbata]RXR35729.1 hypothetical protein EQW78_05255 [Oerskovia turbata]